VDLDWHSRHCYSCIGALAGEAKALGFKSLTVHLLFRHQSWERCYVKLLRRRPFSALKIFSGVMGTSVNLTPTAL